ncbi:MAG TPA: hypothetical protein VHD63_20635, partial [Ktedonobacteraceae bacterium]|nr:hypothetical protein [Ktedonobacteraceae bacterium]
MADYQQLYEQHHSRPLRERSNRREHPEPVATTWDLSFRAVAPQDPAAADLLRFCAFLAPDALLTTGARVLGPRLAPVAADPLALRTYLLVERDGEARTLSVHRLVQAVVREALAEEEQRTWAGRAVLAMEKAFPWPDVRTNWDRCQQL